MCTTEDLDFHTLDLAKRVARTGGVRKIPSGWTDVASHFPSSSGKAALAFQIALWAEILVTCIRSSTQGDSNLKHHHEARCALSNHFAL